MMLALPQSETANELKVKKLKTPMPGSNTLLPGGFRSHHFFIHFLAFVGK